MTSAVACTLDAGPASSLSSKHLPQLDGIRGMAILMVVACHYLQLPSVPAFDSQPLVRGAILGWTGVDLFFVLSGFLLGGILMDQKGSPGYFRRFYLRRAARILP